MMSATFPASSVPTSAEIPNAWLAFTVAARNASRGVSPRRTSSANSRVAQSAHNVDDATTAQSDNCAIASRLRAHGQRHADAAKQTHQRQQPHASVSAYIHSPHFRNYGRSGNSIGDGPTGKLTHVLSATLLM